MSRAASASDGATATGRDGTPCRPLGERSEAAGDGTSSAADRLAALAPDGTECRPYRSLALAFAAPLAAISAAPATPAPVAIKDIAPPVDVFPYPLWMVVAAAVLALALLAGLVWFVVAMIKNRPAPPPLSATAIALRELEELRARLNELAPYQFSIAVSDVLRTFISKAKFRLSATTQTSTEFLAAISNSPNFSDTDRSLLAGFLEHCDMIKFARIDATADDSAKLLESAIAFVQGGRA